MIIAYRDGHDIPPVPHVALPKPIIACHDDRPVRFQSDRVNIACRDGHDIPPVAHVALPIPIPACRDDRPVRFQSDRVIIACRDGHDIRPVAHLALPIIILACRDDRPVRFQSDRVRTACRDFSFMQILITDLIAALERILVFAQRLECYDGFIILPVLHHLDRSIIPIAQKNSPRRNRNRNNRNNRNHCNRYVSSTSSLLRLLLVYQFLGKLFALLRFFPTILVIAQCLEPMPNFRILILRFGTVHSAATFLIFAFNLLISLLNYLCIHLLQLLIRISEYLAHLILCIANILFFLLLSCFNSPVEFRV